MRSIRNLLICCWTQINCSPNSATMLVLLWLAAGDGDCRIMRWRLNSRGVVYEWGENLLKDWSKYGHAHEGGNRAQIVDLKMVRFTKLKNLLNFWSVFIQNSRSWKTSSIFDLFLFKIHEVEKPPQFLICFYSQFHEDEFSLSHYQKCDEYTTFNHKKKSALIFYR